MSGSLRFIDEFQWFLMELSVRPSRTLAISAHLLSTMRCIKKRIHSSSLFQLIFLILGFKWLCQRSLHYFPTLQLRCWEIKVHFWGPLATTSCRTRQSSSAVQAPFTLNDLLSLRILCYKNQISLEYEEIAIISLKLVISQPELKIAAKNLN